MSAWLCTSYHIGRIAEYADRKGLVRYATPSHLPEIDAGDAAIELAVENLKSLDYRYSDSGGAAGFLPDGDNPASFMFECANAVHGPCLEHSAADIWHAVQCLKYQSCEHPTWKESRAFRILELVENETAHRMSEELNASGWGLEGPEVGEGMVKLS